MSKETENSQEKTKRIALIDGYGFVFRAYHSLPPLTRNDKTPVGAVYGFTNMLIKLLASLDVTHMAVVFDAGSKTFRNEIFSEYKSNRPPCPEDLIPQFPIVREAAESLNLAILEKIGFEADDIIATIAKKFVAGGDKVLIVSSDKDLMQLVDDKILMYDAMKNKIIGINEVKEKFFVEPKKVLDVLALMGDSSDNIPGVKGIGPKTAAELIDQFGNLENIFLNLDNIKQEKRRQILKDGVENAKLSKILASLKDDVELGITFDDLEIKSIEPNKLISFLEKQGFRSLVLRVKKEFDIKENDLENYTNIIEEKTSQSFENKTAKVTKKIASNAFKDIKITEITDKEKLQNIFQTAEINGTIVIDYKLDNSKKKISTVTISTAKNDENIKEIFYFKLEEKLSTKSNSSQSFDLFSFSEIKEEINNSTTLCLEDLELILNNNSVKKIFFNAKEFFKIAYDTNLQINDNISYEDLSLINHLINSSIKNNLREIIEINIDEELEESGFNSIFDEIEKEQNGKKFDENILNDEEKLKEFFAFKNFSIFQIYKTFSNKIFELKLNFAYLAFELPLLQIIAKMEHNGIKIDVDKLRNLSKEFGEKIKELSKEIYEIAGEEFNIASTQQLGKILFEKLQLSSSKKSKKTGVLSTKSSVLEELDFEGHKIAGKVLEFRKFSKLKNTYTDSLPEEINQKTARIHSTFLTTSTVTGRFSSNNPNLQNIPIKSLEGKKIREAFIAKENCLLISADYSQVELRVIAHVAKIDNLIKAFKENKDIHRITASQVMGVSENEVTDEMRSKAKAINFGIIYGISAFGLAKQLKISRQEADSYIKS
ncbi:MAG: DNA polymerase I [Pelagibacterales bacterium]|nr:DNA polymerase I [Pelagibacterales bacterium]